MDILFNSCKFLQIMNNLDKRLKQHSAYYTIYIKQSKYYSYNSYRLPFIVVIHTTQSTLKEWQVTFSQL